MKLKVMLLVLVSVSQSILAYSIGDLVSGEVTAQFLKIGVGAKACAMGEAFTAIADDATAIYYNPAGLTQLTKFEILAMQNFWLLDMSYQYLAAALPSQFGSFGVAVAYSSSGKLHKYENYQYIGDYTAYDASATITYAHAINNFSVGVSVKGIQQKIEEVSALGVAADFGLFYHTKPTNGPEVRQIGIRDYYPWSNPYGNKQKSISASKQNFRAGIVLQNLGPDIKFIEKKEPLPMNIKAGVSYTLGYFTLGADIFKPNDDHWKGSLGTELSIKNILFLRAGYLSENKLVYGIGLVLGKESIDYAYTPFIFSTSHRISASVQF
jgi:hypothetical protein